MGNKALFFRPVRKSSYTVTQQGYLLIEIPRSYSKSE